MDISMSGEGNKRMNTRYNMIIVKGEIKTAEIACCSYNSETQNGMLYLIMEENIHMHMKILYG